MAEHRPQDCLDWGCPQCYPYHKREKTNMTTYEDQIQRTLEDIEAGKVVEFTTDPIRMQEAPVLGETEAQRVARIKATLDRIERRPILTVEEELAEGASVWQQDAERMSLGGYSIGGNDLPPAPLSFAVQRLHSDAQVPTQATPGDAGYDLHSIEAITVHPETRALVGTGIAVAIPLGYVGFIKPRSGLAWKNGINILGGVIDAGYRGEVRVILHNTSGAVPFNVNVGDRIAQLVIQPVASLDIREVETLPGTERGQGGFGSTGK